MKMYHEYHKKKIPWDVVFPPCFCIPIFHRWSPMLTLRLGRCPICGIQPLFQVLRTTKPRIDKKVDSNGASSELIDEQVLYMV